MLVECADHRSPWVPCTKGQRYRDTFARVQSLLPCSFSSHPSKDNLLSNNMLTVIRFRVGYVHLSLIFIKKNRKCHKEIERNIPWHDNALTGIFRISSKAVSDCPTDGLIPRFRWGDSFWQFFSIQLRHNEPDGVSNHQHRDCLLNRLFRRRSEKTSKLRITGLCDRRIPRTKDQYGGKCFHLMTSSCNDSLWFLLPRDWKWCLQNIGHFVWASATYTIYPICTRLGCALFCCGHNMINS